jgi:hypothetical protein
MSSTATLKTPTTPSAHSDSATVSMSFPPLPHVRRHHTPPPPKRARVGTAVEVYPHFASSCHHFDAFAPTCTYTTPPSPPSTATTRTSRHQPSRWKAPPPSPLRLPPTTEPKPTTTPLARAPFPAVSFLRGSSPSTHDVRPHPAPKQPRKDCKIILFLPDPQAAVGDLLSAPLTTSSRPLSTLPPLSCLGVPPIVLYPNSGPHLLGVHLDHVSLGPSPSAGKPVGLGIPAALPVG